MSNKIKLKHSLSEDLVLHRLGIQNRACKFQIISAGNIYKKLQEVLVLSKQKQNISKNDDIKQFREEVIELEKQLEYEKKLIKDLEKFNKSLKKEIKATNTKFQILKMEEIILRNKVFTSKNATNRRLKQSSYHHLKAEKEYEIKLAQIYNK